MQELKVVGKSIVRVDGYDKVTGKATYPDDLYMENMLYGHTLRSSRPSANIEIDIQRALNMPGVEYIFTHKDVKNNCHGVLLQDHEVFCSQRVRRIGDPIAFVVARHKETAKNAAAMIEVKYTDLPAVFDSIEAMAPDAPKVHGDNNIIYHYKLRKGNIEQAFKKCHIIIENIYKTSMVDHCFLQPESGLSYIDEEGRIVIAASTQYPHYDREEICHSLGLNHEDIRIITTAVGGAFGGREDITMQIHLALAVQKLGRPVKVTYSKEESFNAHSKRHPMILKYKTGALKDGRLYAMEAEIIGDSGAYASWAINILRKAGVHATGPYIIPNVKVDSLAVYTNNPFTGAMRGFGAAQVAIAYEQQIDEIARCLNINPVEIRLKNCFKQGSKTATGQVLEESIAARSTITKAAKAFGYKFDGRVGHEKKG